jgi:hypothetical protein
MGFKVVRLDPEDALAQRILEWTRTKQPDPLNNPDNVVAVEFQVGGHVRFSNTLMGYADPAPNTSQANRPSIFDVQWDPPNETRPRRGLSQHTYFVDELAPASPGDRHFSLAKSTDEGYPFTAVNFFVETVLASYLTRRRYVVAPSPDVLRVLDGRAPANLAEIASLVRANPEFLNAIQVEEETLTHEWITPALRDFCLALLDNAAALQRYLEAGQTRSLPPYPGAEQLTTLEKEACLRAALEKRELILDTFNYLELGRAPGDDDTYILVGVDRAHHAPDPRGMQWLWEQLRTLAAHEKSFTPAFGCLVTEARARYRVITGPGVTQREFEFLAFAGHELLDCRDGQSIIRALWPEEKLSPSSG